MNAVWPYVCLLGLVVVLWVLDNRYPARMQHLEEQGLVIIVLLIMAVSFGQVVARYGFNTGWSAALEFNTVLFSWLILLGMSYGVRTSLHLGVDWLLNHVSTRTARLLSLFGAVCVIAYGLILLDSAWLAAMGFEVRGGAMDYWLKMFKVGIGSEELRYPMWAQETFGLQARVHRWLVLLALPVGLTLMSLRGLQAFVAIARGDRARLISAHEAESAIKEETR